MAALTLIRRLRRVCADSRGTELVEFALVLPIILVVFAAVVDFGLLFNNYETVTNAAREGARLATLPGWTDDDVTDRVNAYLTAGGLSADAVTTTVDRSVLIDVGGADVNGVKVVVSYPYSYLILGPLIQFVGGEGGSYSQQTLRASATMRTEVAAGL